MKCLCDTSENSFELFLTTRDALISDQKEITGKSEATRKTLKFCILSRGYLKILEFYLGSFSQMR